MGRVVHPLGTSAVAVEASNPAVLPRSPHRFEPVVGYEESRGREHRVGWCRVGCSAGNFCHCGRSGQSCSAASSASVV